MTISRKKLVIGATIAATLGGVVWLTSRQVSTVAESCHDREYAVAVKLQSGESGTIRLTGNQCELPLPDGSSTLDFSVREDGAIQNTVSDTKLYIWKRNESIDIESQIKSILDNRQTDNDCIVEKSTYPQHDRLETYGAIHSQSQTACFMFGQVDDYSSELYFETNGLLIVQRQEGAGGIEPYDLKSIRFLEQN